MKILQFLDHLIPYETFLNDLSSRIVRQLKADKDDPEFISQRKAYELFGRRNVERWKRQGKVVSYKRPGKVEYRTADLRLLQRTTQDYFDESQPKQTAFNGIYSSRNCNNEYGFPNLSTISEESPTIYGWFVTVCRDA